MSAPTPTWYDLLGVEPDADQATIRAAWRAAIADLDPGDRRFRARNQAAEVLLDPERRAAYDAGLEAPEEEPDIPEAAPEPASPEQPGTEQPGTEQPGTEQPDTEQPDRAALTAPTGAGAPRRGVPSWLLGALAVLAVVGVALVAWVATRPSAESVGEATRAAQAAAEEAVVPVLSYDHRSLEEDGDRARDHLTADYREDYDKLFEVISQNAPRTQTSVDVEVVASGIVRSGEDRVQVLLFVDRPTTNKLSRQPVVYEDQVTLTMQRVAGEWLVDDMTTSPPAQ